MGVREFSKEYNQKAEKKGGVREFSREYNKQRQADTNYTPYIGTAQEYTAAKQRNTLSPEARAAGGFSADATPSLHVSPQNELHAAGNRAKREIYSGVKDAVRVTRPIDTAKGLASGTNNGGEAKAYKSVPGGFDAEEYKAARRMMTYDFDAELDSLEEKRKQLEQKRQSQGYMNPSRYELLGEIEALDKQISALKTERNIAQIYRKMQEYYALQNKSDFASVSASEQYKDTNLYQSVFGSMGDLSPDMLNRAHREEYDRIVDTYGAASEEAKQYLLTYIDNGVRVTAENVHTLTDEEKRIFNYILNTDGEDAASEYLTFMQDTMNQRAALENYARLEEIQNGSVGAFTWLNRHASPVIHSAYTGGETAERGLASVFSNDASSSKSEYLNSMLRENSGSFQRFAMDAAQAVGNMVPSAAVGVINPAAGRVVLGLTAGGNAKREALRMGYTQEQATAYGVLVGVSEATLEKLLGGIQSLSGGKNVHPKIENVLFKLGLKNQTAARALHTYLGNMADEFAEEYLQEILEPVFRNICLDENNEFKLFSEDALYSGLLGAINAAVLNIPYIPDMRAAAREASYQNIYDHILGPLDNGQGKTNASQSTRQRGLSDVSEITSQDVADTLTQSGLDVETAEKIAPDLQSAIIRASEKAAANTDANIRPVSVNAQTGSDGAQDAVYEKLRRVAEEMYDGANDAVSPEISTQETVSAPMRMDSETTSTMQSERLFHDTNTPVRTEEIRARDIQEVARFAAGLGNAGRDVFVSMYDPDMDSASYLEGMTAYYNAGKNGGALSDVQAQYGNILSQPAREAAHFAGQVDAKATRDTVTYKSGVRVSESIAKTFVKAAQDLHVHITYGGRAPVVNGVKDRAYITRNGDLRIYEDIEVHLADGRILKNEDAATMVILGHEMTHRLKQLDSKSYDAFCDFVLARKSDAIDGYMKTGLSRDAAIDEIAADYAMTTLFADQKTINEVTTKHSKLAEMIRDILEWIKAKLGFRSSELERAIRLWNNAYNAAVRSAKNGDAVQNGNVGVDVQYSRAGYTKDGIEVYETSDEVKALSYNDRKAKFLDIMTDQYQGRTARFIRNGHTYYAVFSKDDLNKNIYGDKKSDPHGWKAKINVGADGDIFDLVENSTYSRSKQETGKSNKSHKSINYWDYFVKTVQIDGRVYDLVANIRKSVNNQYVYSLQLTENKKIGAAPPLDTTNGVLIPGAHRSNNNVTQNTSVVNSYSMQNSQNNTSEDSHSVDGTEEILFESEAEKARYVADSFDLSAAEQFKTSGYMERISGIAASISKAHRVNKESRVKLTKALKKGVQNMYQAANGNADIKAKQTAAQSFLKAAKIISPDADAQAQVEIADALSKSIWAEMTTDRRVDTIRSIRDEAINSARADVRAARLAELGEKYGTIKPGEKPSRTVTLPKKTSDNRHVSQTVRTVMEAAATPDEMIPTIEQMVSDGEFSYEAITDKEAIADAENKITENGFDSTVNKWFKSVGSGKVSKENTALGWAIFNNAANSGNRDLAVDVLCEMVNHQRNAAQALQASRILKKMSPSAQLYAAQRTVQNLQEELTERYGDRTPNLKIDPDLADKVIHGETAEEREKALQSLYRDIGRQLPSTVLDKWNAWRYLAMLGNVRTHIRNISGNAVFVPVVTVKNIVATGIETVCGFASRGEMKRTKAFVGLSQADRALLAAAWSDYESVADAALGQTKYSESQYANKYIEEGRQIFKIKPLEAARRGNSKLLDMEDSWFSKPHYANAMAQYCKANGITAEQIQSGTGLDQARAYAIKEAQKATYRDTNAFSELFSKVGKLDESGQFKTAKRIWNRGVEGVLPFRKTPANILARGVEYSPVGFVAGVADLFRIKSGKTTAAEAIDKIASGLTGSGLMALGAYLVSQGILRGIGEDDDKEKAFQELMGHQSYALEIGNISVTLDWLAPEALPFFVGANIMEEFMKDGEMNINKVVSAFARISDPMLSMSCLQGLNDLIESVSYSSSSGIASIAASAATSYLMQGIPTVFGQIERTSESERMTTYTDKNNEFLTTDMQYTIGKVMQKLPGDFNQIPYIDAWGRTESNGSVGERAFNNFINPAYISTVQESAMEKELLRLYKSTGETVLPSRADKYIYIDQDRVYLNAEEYQTYAVTKGQTAYRLLTEITASKAYADMDDYLKAEAVSYAYSYANAIAKRDATADWETPYKVTSWMEKCETGTENGVRVTEFILSKAAISNINEGYTDSETGETIENSESLRKMEAIYAIPGLNDEKRAYLFEAFGVGKKVKHYNKNCVAEHLEKMRKKAGIK